MWVASQREWIYANHCVIKNKCAEDKNLKNNSIKLLHSSWFSNTGCFFYSGKFSWDVLGLYLGKTLSNQLHWARFHTSVPSHFWVSCMAPRLAGQHIRNKMHPWYVTLQFCCFSSKIISCTVFCSDRRCCKFHLTGLCTKGSVDDSPPRCHHTATTLPELKSIFNWLDYCRTMAPLLCFAERLLLSISVGILHVENFKCSKSKQT